MARLLAALLLTAAARPPAPTDLLLEGATVYVVADAAPRKASVLIAAGKIAFVGDASAAREKAGGAPRIDLTGAFLFPAWPTRTGIWRAWASRSRSPICAVRGIPARRRNASQPSRRSCRRAPGRRDAAGIRTDGPAASSPMPGISTRSCRIGRPWRVAWTGTRSGSTRRLFASSVPPQSREDPEGGRVLRRADGSPSGVFVDNAMSIVEKVMPEPSQADFARRLLAAARACAKAGLTQVQDASAYSPAEIDAISRLAGKQRASDPHLRDRLLPRRFARGRVPKRRSDRERR